MILVVKPAAPIVLTKRGAIESVRFQNSYDGCPHDYVSGFKGFLFKRDIYAAVTVKETLLSCQYKKCAFCESKIPPIDYGDVEHLRPKGGYTQNATDTTLCKPGYYWLAYTWENLFLACTLCNQEFKKNQFPLRNPKQRAKCHHDDISKEQPLLIDPSKVDPSKHIRFNDEIAYPVRGSRLGKETIAIVGLNRSALVEYRREYLDDLRLIFKTLTVLSRQLEQLHCEQDLIDHADIKARLNAKRSPLSQYSAMARDYLQSVDFV